MWARLQPPGIGTGCCRRCATLSLCHAVAAPRPLAPRRRLPPHGSLRPWKADRLYVRVPCLAKALFPRAASVPLPSLQQFLGDFVDLCAPGPSRTRSPPNTFGPRRRSRRRSLANAPLASTPAGGFCHCPHARPTYLRLPPQSLADEACVPPPLQTTHGKTLSSGRHLHTQGREQPACPAWPSGVAPVLPTCTLNRTAYLCCHTLKTLILSC